MKLQYQAKDRSGQTVTGELEAASLADGRLQLRRQGLFPMSLKPLAAGAAVEAAAAPRRTRRVKSGELVTMLSQLTIMCQSGVALADALHHLAKSARGAALKNVLQRLDEDVASGASLSAALRNHPGVFSDTFVAGIAAGEQSGNLVQVLERLSGLLRNERRLRKSIWAMLTYPLLLCIVMVLVLVGLVFFVFRRFGEVFAGFGHPPPPLTQFLLNVGEFARTNILLILLGAVVLAGGMVYFRTLPAASRLWDYFVMNTVVIRNATRTLTTGRSFYLLGTMLQSGVPLLDSLRLCRSTARSYLFRNLFDQMEQDLLQGRAISGPLESATFLPSDAAQMIATAERSGRLGQVLLTVGHYYDEEGETSVRNIVKLAEPALIVALAAVVGTVVLSVMLPLFDASTMAQ